MSLWPDLKLPPINLWSAPKLLGRSYSLADLTPAEQHPPATRRTKVAPISSEIQRLMKTR